MVQIDLEVYERVVGMDRTPVVLEVYEPEEVFLGYKAGSDWTLLESYAEPDYLENGQIREESIEDLLLILNDPLQSRIIMGGNKLEVIARKVDENGNEDGVEVGTVLIGYQDGEYRVLEQEEVEKL